MLATIFGRVFGGLVCEFAGVSVLYWVLSGLQVGFFNFPR